jgi:hypothetical protein
MSSKWFMLGRKKLHYMVHYYLKILLNLQPYNLPAEKNKREKNRC